MDEMIRDRLLATHDRLLSEGALPSAAQLESYYKTFRDRFGSSSLAQLDGETLLDTMHRVSNRDSLVYWLEFKNDDEMPAVFGSIAGGSSFKFGIYYSAEAQSWVAGSAQKKKYLSLDEAIGVARSHRDQLIAGAEALSTLSVGTGDDLYSQLQDQLMKVAPSLADSSWGHKYFSLLFPDRLDDYHAAAYQRFHLTKCLQVPPARDGRYVCAGRFVQMAQDLGIPMNHLTSTLNEVNGNRPYSYWLFEVESETWRQVLEEQSLALGWPLVGDLSELSYAQQSKDEVARLLKEKYPAEAKPALVKQLFYFTTLLAERDLVVAHTGSSVQGIGRVTGPYLCDESSPLPHRRQVEWVDVSHMTLPVEADWKRPGFVPLYKPPEVLVEVETHVLRPQQTVTPAPPSRGVGPVPRLQGTMGRIQMVLERKGQVIVYGPPGTGKTYWAERAAKELASLRAFGQSFDALNDEEKRRVFGARDSLVQICTFHPAYGYEDFVEGYRPGEKASQLVFNLQAGIFKSLCATAEDDPERNYYLIVDEINRGDIPRIFGELITVLELSKRGMPVTLPLSGTQLVVPKNLYVIGTMNTADRSIALLDTALRRRFGFIELMPDAKILAGASALEVPLSSWLSSLNQRIREQLGQDGRNLQIGHSYLMHGGKPIQSASEFKRVLRDDILPLLQEYCYEDWDGLASILGTSLVDRAQLSFHEELFSEGRESDLTQALLAMNPEIATSAGALTVDEAMEEVAEDEEDQSDTPSAAGES